MLLQPVNDTVELVFQLLLNTYAGREFDWEFVPEVSEESAKELFQFEFKAIVK